MPDPRTHLRRKALRNLAFQAAFWRAPATKAHLPRPVSCSQNFCPPLENSCRQTERRWACKPLIRGSNRYQTFDDPPPESSITVATTGVESEQFLNRPLLFHRRNFPYLPG